MNFTCTALFKQNYLTISENGYHNHINGLLVEYSGVGDLESVKKLVKCGADIRADNDLALQWAAYYGHLEVVKWLHQNGADIRANDAWALQLAAKNGHLEVVKYLEDEIDKLENIS